MHHKQSKTINIIIKILELWQSLKRLNIKRVPLNLTWNKDGYQVHLCVRRGLCPKLSTHTNYFRISSDYNNIL